MTVWHIVVILNNGEIFAITGGLFTCKHGLYNGEKLAVPTSHRYVKFPLYYFEFEVQREVMAQNENA